MRRRKVVELEVNQERWLVSYADFITLLFAFFVVMYSVSQVNEGKYRILSDQLLSAFSPQAIAPIQVGDPSRSPDPSAINLQEEPGEGPADEAGAGLADLSQLSQQMSQRFADLVDDQLLQVTAGEEWLELELQSSILFPSGEAAPSLQARAIFDEVAGLLAAHDNAIQVQGYTDNVPIANAQFNNNWELSSARAAAVVALLANNGVAPQRLSAVGFGEYRPLADNSSAEGRAKNRRVTLRVANHAVQLPTSTDAAEAPTTDAPNRPDTADSPAPASSSTNSNTDPTSNPAASPAAGAAAPEPAATPLIEPIELDNGGLLFTSDPERSRRQRPVESDREQ